MDQNGEGRRVGKLLRLPAVMERTSLGRSSIYSKVQASEFPSPVRLSVRAVAWREEEIEDWVASRTKTVIPATAHA
ncbi:MAG: AlpA family transcriptional regulator [Burkholderiaceae bacterium]|nr:AlpA family transcriptional regulator [Burkholderiaceae bacterium]